MRSRPLLSAAAIVAIILTGCGGSKNTIVPLPKSSGPNPGAPPALLHALQDTYVGPISSTIQETVSSGGKTLKMSFASRQNSLQQGAFSLTVTGLKGTVTEYFSRQDGVSAFSPNDKTWYSLGGDLSSTGAQIQSETTFLGNAQELSGIRLVSSHGDQATYQAQFAPGALNKILAATEGTSIAQEIQVTSSQVSLVANTKEGFLEDIQGTFSLIAQGQPVSLTLVGSYARLARTTFPRVTPTSTITSAKQLEDLIKQQVKR